MIIKLNKKLTVILLSVMLLCAALSVVGSCETKQKIQLPVIMYHQVCTDKSKTGKYTVTLSELENDLIFLEKNGYTAVSTRSLVDFVYYGKKMPSKPILISFDDGNESIYKLVEPLLKKHGMCCTCCVIGSVSEFYSGISDHNIAYSHLTWDEVRELSMGDTVEIHSHSYDMHYCEDGKRKGMQPLYDESDSDYSKAIYTDLSKLYSKLQSLQAENTAMFYPYGYYNDTTEKIIKSMGYQLSFTCEERINTITVGNKNSLYRLGRYNRPSGISSDEFFSFLF